MRSRETPRFAHRDGFDEEGGRQAGTIRAPGSRRMNRLKELDDLLRVPASDERFIPTEP